MWYGIHNDTPDKKKDAGGIEYMGMLPMSAPTGHGQFEEAVEVVRELGARGVDSAIIHISSNFDRDVTEIIAPHSQLEDSEVIRYNQRVVEEFRNGANPFDKVVISVMAPLADLKRAGVDVSHPENVASAVGKLQKKSHAALEKAADAQDPTLTPHQRLARRITRGDDPFSRN
jgi:hypothetical protein